MKALCIGLLLSAVIMADTMVPFAENVVLVRFTEETKVETIQSELKSMGFTPDKRLVRQLNIWLLAADPDLYPDTRSALPAITKRGDVLWAQLDHLVSEREAPDDPIFGDMWDMHNTGQNGGTVDADIDAPEAWDITTGGGNALGEEIVVAVIDSGFDWDHEDLIDNVWFNTNEIEGNGIDDDANGYIDDIVGWDAYGNDPTLPTTSSHGTHVAGTVGARGNNGIDVVGVNWDVKVMCVAGSSGNTSVISIAYGYVLDQKTLWYDTDGEFGANVVATNSSFGVDYADCESGSYPLWNDLYDAMGAVGILSAAATINSNQNVDIIGDVPTGCSSDYIIAVTNTNRNDEKYSSAGYGATTIDLGAPGTQICSTIPNDNISCSKTGTSMASPHVAGAVGLLHSAVSAPWVNYYHTSPAMASLILKDIILDTVDPLPTLDGTTVSGGRLNLYNAVLAAGALTVDAPVGDLNMDNEVNVLDVILLVSYILGTEIPTPDQIVTADLDYNGILNVVDIVLLINIIVGR